MPINKYYIEVVELWQKFCEEHSALYDLTCQEYSHLLLGEIDKIEELIQQKELVLDQIKILESIRLELINTINHHPDIRPESPIRSVSELIEFFKKFEKNFEQNHLLRFNGLLIDIIEKIQFQNRKNQVFINKSIKSIREIKEGLLGKKDYSVYNAQGISSPSLNK